MSTTTKPQVQQDEETDPTATSWLSSLGWLAAGALALIGIVPPLLRWFFSAMGMSNGTCDMLTVYGVPCPGCGITRCVTHMAHFEPVEAAAANPWGVLLFLLAAALIPVAIVGMVKRLPLIDTLYDLKMDFWCALLLGSALLVWGVRIAKHLLL